MGFQCIYKVFEKEKLEAKLSFTNKIHKAQNVTIQIQLSSITSTINSKWLT